ncbi:glycosyltransferase family 4 protein [Marinobacter nanhaiticus D15-8W]|uniref:Glycosyltransferase family 1 protein n=1 Tax=Marinobacter nanhaiticus D15-8W TaxID=626887 RepID=N6WS14_9GAMM|nr:glycosyltransferase family 4 protein [Marinobacter nanhaiticus]ENO14336.1 glycosyltransferase family 1 protein [Marinobacter nanhaiticus D15-8W]BES71724.1 glycosyltransferase family 4 protein [Marinobacter nanhaiticus D15-8W]
MRSDRPHIVFLAPGDPNQRTGGYGYTRRIVQCLRDRGHTVDLDGLEGAFPETDALAQRAMDNALDALEDNTVVIIDGLALCGLPALADRHIQRLRVLALEHHPLADETGLTQAQQAYFFQSEKAALARVGGVIVTSDFTARRLQDFDVDPSRIEVVTPGVDRPVPADAGKRLVSDRPLEILCVATLAPRKAQDVLVEALARCQDYDWHCTLAGSTDRHPDYVASLKAQIDQLHLNDRIELCGELEEQGLAEAYRNADLFVLPSWYEGYGMVITEALAYGLPVITTTGGALAYTASDQAAIKVQPGDAGALGAAMIQLFSSSERLQQLVAGAAQARDELQSWSEAGERFAKAIDTLLSGR